METLSDAQLLDALRDAQTQVTLHAADQEKRQGAWQEVIDLMRELERRYPPATDPVG